MKLFDIAFKRQRSWRLVLYLYEEHLSIPITFSYDTWYIDDNMDTAFIDLIINLILVLIYILTAIILLSMQVKHGL